jgi:membrane fusion protein (multidrug efflux system)
MVFSNSCGQKGQQSPPPPVVKVVKVLQQDVPIYKEFVGQIYGIYDIPIRARVEGWLEKISFVEGGKVKKGQLLYTIDPQPFEARVAEAMSKLAASRTDLVNAESEYNRYKPLVKKNAVSQSDYDAAKANFEAAQASVKAAEANLRSAQINLSYTSMRSPLDGIIGKTQARVGEFVGKSPNPVILNTVSKIDTMRVEFFLSESDYLIMARFARSQQKSIGQGEQPRAREKTLELLLADGSSFEEMGWVAFVDREVNPGTGSILIQALFPNSKRLLKPGQFARVKAIIQEVEDAILVPQRCIMEQQGEYSVYKLNSDSTVSYQQVEVGAQIGDTWIIREGLDTDDKVVIEGLQFVGSGMRVQAVETEFESKSDRIKSN